MNPISSAIKGFSTALGSWNQEANKFNLDQVNSSRAWQQQMDDTKYQRAKADMEAAGLNWRTLAGGGASASSMPASVMQTYDSQAMQSGLSNGVSIGNSAINSITKIGTSVINGAFKMFGSALKMMAS